MLYGFNWRSLTTDQANHAPETQKGDSWLSWRGPCCHLRVVSPVSSRGRSGLQPRRASSRRQRVVAKMLAPAWPLARACSGLLIMTAMAGPCTVGKRSRRYSRKSVTPPSGVKRGRNGSVNWPIPTWPIGEAHRPAGAGVSAQAEAVIAAQHHQPAPLANTAFDHLLRPAVRTVSLEMKGMKRLNVS